jgi:putative ABC transport system permease protein
MLINSIRIGFRHLSKSRVFAFINVSGIAVGISAFFFIAHYISFHLSFDNFHSNKDQIYRIVLNRYENGELVETSARTFAGIRALLKQNFPEVQHVTGFIKIPANTGFLFRYNGRIYNEAGGWLSSDSSFFNVFPSLLLHGDAATALQKPNSIIISETLAKKVFGDEDPIGKTLDRIDDHTSGQDFTVTAVLRNIPDNAHFHATVVQHIYDSWPGSDEELWGEGRLSTYATFSKSVQVEMIEKRLNSLLAEIGKENAPVKDTRVVLQPMKSIHLSSSLPDEIESNGDKELLFLLSAVGLTILIMAWINYVNLETSRLVLRIREFGIRRIIGSGRSALAFQFLMEYFVLAVAALVIAAVIVIYLLPYYSSVTGIELKQIESLHPGVWFFALVLFLAGSVLVGIYPVFYFLRFSPTAALKGYVSTNTSASTVRKSFVVVQFTASIVLIAFVMTVALQLDHMKRINKGVQLETVIALRNPTAYSDQEVTAKYSEFQTFKERLLQYPSITAVASSSAIPGAEIGFTYVDLLKRNVGDPYDARAFKTMFVSADFISTYGIELLAGNSFSTPPGFVGEAPWDAKNWSNIILNETAIRHLGFQSIDAAINQEVYFSPFDDQLKCRIIGVIDDYLHESAKKTVYPTILFHNFGSFQQVYFSIQVNPGSNLHQTLADVEKIWKRVWPDRPFEFFFLDEYYDRQFKSEVSFQRIFTLFAGIAIVVACLGILGMTLFQMNSKLKEVSIRKVLGASVFGLILLLSKLNVKLVLISSVISAPLIYVLSKEWLSVYPEKIHLNAWFTVFSVLILFTAVIFVTCLLILRIARANPVDHLKRE